MQKAFGPFDVSLNNNDIQKEQQMLSVLHERKKPATFSQIRVLFTQNNMLRSFLLVLFKTYLHNYAMTSLHPCDTIDWCSPQPIYRLN